jgi:hypothetical protein
MDLGFQGDGLRDISATVGYDTKLLKIFQTFYYTRAVTLIPSLQQFADANGRKRERCAVRNLALGFCRQPRPRLLRRNITVFRF